MQGADLTRMTDKTAPRVTITHHPDVRRELMLQKAYAEGMRALVLYTASLPGRRPDRPAARASGDERGRGAQRPAAAAGQGRRLGALVRAARPSLQTLGGSGFLQDYPIEQYIRDAKIDSLYEGTTAIQGLDLFFRKIVRDQGKALGTLLGEIDAFAESEAGNGRLKEERELLAEAAADVQGDGRHHGRLGARLAEQDAKEIYKVGLNTTRFLLALGDLVIGWLLLRQAEARRWRGSPTLRRGPRLLPGQGRGGVVLRQDRAAAARRRAAGRRDHRQRPDGDARGGVLIRPSITTPIRPV